MPKKIPMPKYDIFKDYWKNHNKEETAIRFNVKDSTIDKWVKNYNIFKFKKDYPKCLTDIQKQLVIGSMLGDGCISKPESKKTTFTEVHGIAQEEYLIWKNEILKPFSRSIIYYKCNSEFPNGKKRKQESDVCQMYTVRHKIFYELEKDWYKRDANGNYTLKNNRRIKRLPDNLKLTPFIAAIWFYDDGRNNPQGRNAYISTDAFSVTECERLVNLLYENLNIRARLSKTQENQYETYIPTTSYLDFIKIISDKIPCNCMAYKTNLSGYTLPKRKMRPRLSENDVQKIINLANEGKSTTAIMREVNSSRGNINKIKRGSIWRKIKKSICQIQTTK